MVSLVSVAFFSLCARFKFVGNTDGRVVGQQNPSVKRNVTILSFVVVVIVAVGLFFLSLNAAHAWAKESQSHFAGNSTIQVDEQGKVLYSDIDFTNNSGSKVTIIEVQALEELKGWSVQFSDASLDSGDHITGTWDADRLSEDVLSKLKDSGGELVLTEKTTVKCNVEESRYSVEHYFENLDGTYSEDPDEIVTEYGIEGEPTQARALESKGFTAQDFVQSTINADGTTVVAIDYTRNSYQLEFDGNGHEISTAQQRVKFGDTVIKPTDPTVDGLVFDGWFVDAACTTAFDFENTTMPASNIKLYAKWLKLIDFNLATVDTADKTYNAQEIKPEVSISGLTKGIDYMVAYSDNVKAGTASIKMVGTGNYTGEKTYSFVIIPAEVKVSGITAKDKDCDGTFDAQLDCSKAVIEGLCGTDNGKVTVTAKGAFENADAGENKKVVISDIALQGDAAANYKLAAEGQQTEAMATIVGNYIITYGNADGATNPNPANYKSTDGDIVLADASRDGYDFEGWYEQDGSAGGDWGNKVTLIAKGTNKDVTVYAKWAAKTYHLVYWDNNNGEGKKVAEYDVKCGEKLSAPNIDTTDYIVTGWYESEPLTVPDAKQWDFDKDTMPAQDLMLFAKWHKRLVSVYFYDLDGDSRSAPYAVAVPYGSTVTPTFDYIATGYSNYEGRIFNYWYYDEAGTQRFDCTKPIYDDLSVYGKRYDYAYWLGYVSNQIWPMKEIVKTPDELQADIKVLKDEDHAVYSEEEYNKVKEEYETYMKEDEVCLYTYAGGTGDDSLMAFRIVEVGQHDNGGGTKSDGVLTFQSRSASYKGAKMLNPEESTITTWENSGVRKSLQDSGDIGKKYDKRLMDVMTINKTPYYDVNTKQIAYCDDKLFILSYVEIFGSTDNDHCWISEGAQYAYYKIDGNLDASKLIPLGETITGGTPQETPEPYDSSEESLNSTLWWTRTTCNINTGQDWSVVYRGAPGYPASILRITYPVVPAFSM